DVIVSCTRFCGCSIIFSSYLVNFFFCYCNINEKKRVIPLQSSARYRNINIVYFCMNIDMENYSFA
ncbi:hypothetical protein Avbf_08242, partial [Armadillidium vulgare]